MTTFDPHTHTTWQLAYLADCGSPDRPDRYGFDHRPEGTTTFAPSPGAVFLRAIARDVETIIDDLGDYFDLDTAKDEAHQYVDSSVPIYTHDLWQTFVDLAAYNEDPAETGADPDNGMNGLAGTCLYMIGERLAHALLDEYAETLVEVAR